MVNSAHVTTKGARHRIGQGGASPSRPLRIHPTRPPAHTHAHPPPPPPPTHPPTCSRLGTPPYTQTVAMPHCAPASERTALICGSSSNRSRRKVSVRPSSGSNSAGAGRHCTTLQAIHTCRASSRVGAITSATGFLPAQRSVRRQSPIEQRTAQQSAVMVQGRRRRIALHCAALHPALSPDTTPASRCARMCRSAGKPKARVLPEPVAAMPTTSLQR